MSYTEQHFEAHIEASLVQAGWQSLPNTAYDRASCQLPDELLGFIKESQPKAYQKLQDQYGAETDNKLCKRIHDEIARYGLIHVLRGEVKDRGCSFKLVYFRPRSGLNPDHAELYRFNRFHVVRQVHFAGDEKSIDMGLFHQWPALVTMELKNQLTGANHPER
ncbi:MAG: hypothetical protein IPJ40_07780 [Saprospirales bacterium]|nr:hypothetical protein [Saprospirales bacterium]